MKKTYIMVLAALAAMSCTRETISEKTEGEGSLTLGIRLPVTKAAMTSDQLLSSALVNIYKADFSGLVRAYTYSDAPSVIYLPADQYRVDVIAGEAAMQNPQTASWDQKSYKGSSSFEIESGIQVPVTVEASVSNAVSRITFDQSVAENFSEGFTFKVGLDLDDESTCLTYDSSKSGCDGFFIISSMDEPALNWKFSGTLAKDQSSFIRTGSISDVAPGNSYQMTVKYTIKNGDLEFTLSVDYTTEVFDDVLVFEPVSTGLSSLNIYEVWAGHATVHADVDETEYSDPSAVNFAYRASGEDAWTTVDATRSSEGVYDATFYGLSGASSYEYKLVIDGEDIGEPKTLTTEAAHQMPNSSFEYVSLVSGESYYKWYDPSCSAEEGQTMFWGSGNGEGSEGVKGSASMGLEITVPDEDDKVDGDRSVRAQSTSIIGMLAAGNIFTGQFAGLVGTSGGKVNFGRPWTSRPTALRLYAKYTASTINIVSSVPDGVTITKNEDYDRASVIIALGTWNYKTYGGTKDSPVLVNTTDASTFVDYSTDPSTIANAELILYGDGYQQINGGEKISAETSVWRQITIPLNYHTQTEYPTHIIVSCAASKYGDYFTGSDDAKLWLDKIELIYE
ncbi:MAG: DUF4493 domain-containing protein [Candidatus Cryptobacteroides sp.]